MRMKKKLSALAAACLAALTALSFTGYAASGSDTLRVGVKDYIVDFCKFDETNQMYYGLEVDLAAALMKELGYKNIEYVRVTPDDCEEMVDSGEIDVLIAAYSYTERRASERDFSPSYYRDHAAIMVAKSSLYESPQDLFGKRIGVIHGSSAWFNFGNYFYERGLVSGTDLDTLNKYFEIVRVDEIEDLYHMFEIGEVDAVVSDRTILKTYYDEDEYLIFDDNLSDEDYCAVTALGSDLSPLVYDAMQKLIDDGTVAELTYKWG